VPGVASPVCIAGMVTRGAVPAPLVAGQPMSALVERSLAARGVSNLVSAEGAATGSSVHPVFNLSKLSAQFGVSEHGKSVVSAVVYCLFCCMCRQ